jgi:predicted membrane-bound mannosyltransferase
MLIRGAIDGVANDERAGNRRLGAVALAAIVAVGLLPRLYSLSERSLWFDEAFCWRLIQFPFFEMIEPVGRDNHPPLYFILLKAWATLFGDSAWTLRFLSVLFGLATIAGTYLFASAAYELGTEAVGAEAASPNPPTNPVPKLSFGNVPAESYVLRAQSFRPV